MGILSSWYRKWGDRENEGKEKRKIKEKYKQKKRKFFTSSYISRDWTEDEDTYLLVKGRKGKDRDIKRIEFTSICLTQYYPWVVIYSFFIITHDRRQGYILISKGRKKGKADQELQVH